MLPQVSSAIHNIYGCVPSMHQRAEKDNWVLQELRETLNHVRAHRTYQQGQIYNPCRQQGQIYNDCRQQRRCAEDAQQVLTLLKYKYCMVCFFLFHLNTPFHVVSYSTKWCMLFLPVATSCMLNATHLQESKYL
jgi:hypothetical protein